jgi:gamma-glutamyltranspeptidase/glutathione hydrolase
MKSVPSVVAASTVLLATAALNVNGLTGQEPAARPFWRPVVMGTYGMVAAEHPLETIAGMEILRAGGNAFDAAAAVFYMTTVVEQHQAGIGGDAFILAYNAAEDRMVFINGTGPAPGLATREFYTELGEIPNAGPLATDVPGAPGGFDLALRKYGTMEYAEILAPAIRAARDGHPVDFWAAGYHMRAVEKISPYESSLAVLMPDGRPLGAGDVFVQTDLSRSFEAIARGGTDVFSPAVRGPRSVPRRGGVTGLYGVRWPRGLPERAQLARHRDAHRAKHPRGL